MSIDLVYFRGRVRIDPPLNDDERAYLYGFFDSVRCSHIEGPYYTDDDVSWREFYSGVIDIDKPAHGQPNRQCEWVPTLSGGGMEWSGTYFADATVWLRYIVDHFLCRDPLVNYNNDAGHAPWFEPHVVSGAINAWNTDTGVLWHIEVTNGVVREVLGLHPGAPGFGEESQ